MDFFIICTLGNIILNILLSLFHYKSCSKFEDLGKVTVPISISGTVGKNQKRTYLMKAKINNQETSMIISEKQFEQLESYDTAEIYVRKFPSKFNSYIKDYDFSLHKVDWKKKDKRNLWGAFLFCFTFLEIIIFIISFQV